MASEAQYRPLRYASASPEIIEMYFSRQIGKNIFVAIVSLIRSLDIKMFVETKRIFRVIFVQSSKRTVALPLDFVILRTYNGAPTVLPIFQQQNFFVYARTIVVTYMQQNHLFSIHLAPLTNKVAT